MEEIRVFKAAHRGRISRILPILVNGEPDDVLPIELRMDIVPEERPDGTVCLVEHEVKQPAAFKDLESWWK